MPIFANDVDAALQEVNESETSLEFPAVLESDGFVFRIKWLGQTIWDSWEDEREFNEEKNEYEPLGLYLMEQQKDLLHCLNSEMKDRVARLRTTNGMGATPVSPAPTQTPLVDKMES